jgi:hypothetical protein
VVRSGFAEFADGWFGNFPQEFFERVVFHEFPGKPKSENFGLGFVEKFFDSSS